MRVVEGIVADAGASGEGASHGSGTARNGKPHVIARSEMTPSEDAPGARRHGACHFALSLLPCSAPPPPLSQHPSAFTPEVFMRTFSTLVLLALFAPTPAHAAAPRAEPEARLLRFPTIHKDTIVFV